MSILTPGAYLRQKLVLPRYAVRAESGQLILSVAAHEASVLISKGLVFGKLSGTGDLQYLAALRGRKVLIDAIKAGGAGGVVSAEDNETTLRDGRGYRFHARRVMAWAR